MGKKKSKQDRKREERDRRQAEEQASQEAAQARRQKFRIATVVIFVVALGASLTAYFYGENRQLAGLIGMIGFALLFPLVLGSIGGEVKPRDRNRAGSIDFGNRR